MPAFPLKAQQTLYLFDFDGTITQSDSMFCFLRFVVGDFNFFVKMVWVFPVLGVQKLLGKDNLFLKNYLLRFFLKGKSKSILTEKAQLFFQQKQDKIIRPKALEKIQALRQEKDAVICIVTASLDLWICPFAEAWECLSISTKALYDGDDIFIGIADKNCNGEEKVKRVKAYFDFSQRPKQIIAYGNSSGDQAMYDFADLHFHRHF